MFGFKRKEWKHAYKTEISYLRELAIMGCLLSLLMGSLSFLAGLEEQREPAVAAVSVSVPVQSSTSTPAVPVKIKPSRPSVVEATLEKPFAPEEDEALYGTDPLKNPEVFDKYDAFEKLGGVIAHVPSDKPTHRRDAASPAQVNVVVDKSAHRLTVFQGGKKLREFGIAVGKNIGDKRSSGDMRTPEGSFPVEQIHNATHWVHDFGDGNGMIAGAYGPLFIRLQTPPWKGIGIHGTHDPDSIGSNATEGCVRMQNEDLTEFAGMIDIGTSVTILPN